MSLSTLYDVRVFRVLALCGAYVAASSCLIRFNSYLMKPERFPFAMALTAIHMLSSLGFGLLFYAFRPSAFPGLAQTQGRKLQLLSWFAPVGVAFAVTLFASNSAYKYSSVSFLQFMKEGNLIITFGISVAVGLQAPTALRLIVIAWVFLGSTLSVGGEMHFVLLGFTYQSISQVAECSRHVLGDYIMNRATLKLDPLTYTLFSAPSCLCILLVGNVLTWSPEAPGRALELWHLLLPNAFLAFLLNVIVATVIKEVSAVGFILSGVVKDVMLVSVSSAYFHDHVTLFQFSGFLIALSGVAMWSLMRTHPEHVLVHRLAAALGSQEAGSAKPFRDVENPSSGEKLPLLTSKM